MTIAISSRERISVTAEPRELDLLIRRGGMDCVEVAGDRGRRGQMIERAELGPALVEHHLVVGRCGRVLEDVLARIAAFGGEPAAVARVTRRRIPIERA